MENTNTIEQLTRRVEKASTDFETTNTELKRKYLVWNIETFNIIASAVSVSKGSFGTGYPFYALDENLKGKLPIIGEQIRYNRELVKDGIIVQRSIWECESCLKANYDEMPDLKQFCKPCPNMIDKLKPRKIINRLPDLDMWLICEDGCMNQAQTELSALLEKHNMRTSDIDPLKSLDDVAQISKLLMDGKIPQTFLPIDSHIIEYSKIKQLIEKVPDTLKAAKQSGETPYLSIHPKSYRKQWQYDDEPYNFVYDYLSAFTTFNIPEELQQTLNNSRTRVTNEHMPNELFSFVMKSATKSNARRFKTPELHEIFCQKVYSWKTRENKDKEKDER